MNTASLDREKLARVLGMLGSAHDGEIAAAARKAHALVRDAGLTWQDIISPPPLPVDLSPGSTTWAIRLCADNPEMLTGWERDFIGSLRAQRYPLTPKQRTRLAAIAEKVQRTPARAA